MLIFPVCLLYHKYSDRLQEICTHFFLPITLHEWMGALWNKWPKPLRQRVPSLVPCCARIKPCFFFFSLTNCPSDHHVKCKQSQTHGVCACLAGTCHLQFSAEWPGSFTCYCSNTGVEQIPKWESAQKVNPGKENSPTAPAGTQTHNLLIKSPVLYYWTIPIPLKIFFFFF